MAKGDILWLEYWRSAMGKKCSVWNGIKKFDGIVDINEDFLNDVK